MQLTQYDANLHRASSKLSTKRPPEVKAEPFMLNKPDIYISKSKFGGARRPTLNLDAAPEKPHRLERRISSLSDRSKDFERELRSLHSAYDRACTSEATGDYKSTYEPSRNIKVSITNCEERYKRHIDAGERQKAEEMQRQADVARYGSARNVSLARQIENHRMPNDSLEAPTPFSTIAYGDPLSPGALGRIRTPEPGATPRPYDYLSPAPERYPETTVPDEEMHTDAPRTDPKMDKHIAYWLDTELEEYPAPLSPSPPPPPRPKTPSDLKEEVQTGTAFQTYYSQVPPIQAGHFSFKPLEKGFHGKYSEPVESYGLTDYAPAPYSPPLPATHDNRLPLEGMDDLSLNDPFLHTVQNSAAGPGSYLQQRPIGQMRHPLPSKGFHSRYSQSGKFDTPDTSNYPASAPYSRPLQSIEPLFSETSPLHDFKSTFPESMEFETIGSSFADNRHWKP